MERYRSSEGRELLIPYKGDLNNTVLDYLGGIRSTCTYIGATSIKNMGKYTIFVKGDSSVKQAFSVIKCLQFFLYINYQNNIFVFCNTFIIVRMNHNINTLVYIYTKMFLKTLYGFNNIIYVILISFNIV